MRPEPGKSYLWNEKRILTFIEKDGRSYYFRCADFVNAEDPKGVTMLPINRLKELKPVTA